MVDCAVSGCELSKLPKKIRSPASLHVFHSIYSSTLFMRPVDVGKSWGFIFVPLRALVFDVFHQIDGRLVSFSHSRKHLILDSSIPCLGCMHAVYVYLFTFFHSLPNRSKFVVPSYFVSGAYREARPHMAFLTAHHINVVNIRFTLNLEARQSLLFERRTSTNPCFAVTCR